MGYINYQCNTARFFGYWSYLLKPWDWLVDDNGKLLPGFVDLNPNNTNILFFKWSWLVCFVDIKLGSYEMVALHDPKSSPSFPW